MNGPTISHRQRFRLVLLASTLIAVAAATSALGAAERFTIVAGGDSRIVFQSKAPLEKFEGKTDRVSGWFEADLFDLAAGVSLEVAVELATFDTGKKKRNRHMRENHLETDTYPQAWFRGGQLMAPVPAKLVAGTAVTVKLNGELDLHGVRRPVSCDVELQIDKSGAVLVSAEFPVKLSDHAIERPKFLVMKLADEQKVRVRLRGVRQP